MMNRVSRTIAVAAAVGCIVGPVTAWSAPKQVQTVPVRAAPAALTLPAPTEPDAQRALIEAVARARVIHKTSNNDVTKGAARPAEIEPIK